MNPSKLTVGDWMTADPITIEEDATVVEAIHLLEEKNVRRLPVMRAGKLVGLVTERMLLGCMPAEGTSLDRWELHYLLARTPVRQVMNPTPHTVTPETPLANAARLLHDRKLNGLLVLNAKGDMVGLLTTTDALEALIHFATAAASGS
jgi:acetoin utilization protein AcuB